MMHLVIELTTTRQQQVRQNLTRKTSAILIRLDTKVGVPLKNLSNILRSLGLPLINCKIELDFSR